MWQLMLNLALMPAIAEPTNLSEHKYNGGPQAVALSYLSPYKPSSLSSTTTGLNKRSTYNQDHT